MKPLLALFLSLSVAEAVLGEIRAQVNDEGFLVIQVDAAMEVSAVDIQSVGGFLIPIPLVEGIPDPAPFMFLLSNTTQQVTLANLGTTTTLDDPWITQVGYDDSGDVATDLTIAVGQPPKPPFSCGPVIALTGRVTGSESCLVDFGTVHRNDLEAGLLPDIVELGVYHSTLAFPVIPRVDYSIAGPDADRFDLPDFVPTAPFDDLIDVSFDVSAAPGVYQAQLSFGPSAVFELRAEVVPEPSLISPTLLMLCFSWFWARRSLTLNCLW